MNKAQIIAQEPIVLLEEIKIQSVVEENKFKKWAQENIKNLPPLNVTQEQRSKSKDKISQIQNIKTNKFSIL